MSRTLFLEVDQQTDTHHGNCGYRGSSFSYWLLDDEEVYTTETIYVTMDSNRDLEAHFDEQLPPCELTVIAYEYCSEEPVETDVYVDSEEVGVTPDTFEVELGEREIEVEWYAEYEYGEAYFWYFLVDGDEEYDNPLEVTLSTLHKTIAAVYIDQ